MSVANFRPYDDGEDIQYHDENVVIICDSNATCFGTDPLDLIKEEKKRIEECPDSVDATPEPEGLKIAQNADTDYQSQMQLHVNSLWLVHYSCLLDSDHVGTISNNANLVPDTGQVLVWVDCKDDREEVAENLTGIIPRAYIEHSEADFRRKVWGYLSQIANPENGQEDLKEWSQEVHRTLECIDPQ